MDLNCCAHNEDHHILDGFQGQGQGYQGQKVKVKVKAQCHKSRLIKNCKVIFSTFFPNTMSDESRSKGARVVQGQGAGVKVKVVGEVFPHLLTRSGYFALLFCNLHFNVIHITPPVVCDEHFFNVISKLLLFVGAELDHCPQFSPSNVPSCFTINFAFRQGSVPGSGVISYLCSSRSSFTGSFKVIVHFASTL